MDILGLVIGVLGLLFGVYQYAKNETYKERKGELQYLLAGINSTAIQKKQTWMNQANTIPNPTKTAEEKELKKLHMLAIDGFSEIASLAVNLEGVIDADKSAIAAMLDRGLDIVNKNAKMQEAAREHFNKNEEKNKEKT